MDSKAPGCSYHYRSHLPPYRYFLLLLLSSCWKNYGIQGKVIDELGLAAIRDFFSDSTAWWDACCMGNDLRDDIMDDCQ
jgi:hypothetical protein